MTWIAVAIALASLGFSWHTTRKNTKVVRALEAEKRENDELKTTLVEVLDEEGNIRGQLALPGQVTTQGVSDRLAIAERSVSTIQDEIRDQTQKLKEDVAESAGELDKARSELVEALGREKKLTTTLADVVDGDGTVLAQLRLPGSKKNKGKPPNKTPCGDMCKLAHYVKDQKDSYGRIQRRGGWLCKAGQDRPCDDVRKKFEDADGQCVLWERDDDC
jgi:hypothetical protein